MVLQYVDSSSFGWRKKVMVCGYYSFDVMNERDFRQMLMNSEQAADLSPKELSQKIEKLIETLDAKYNNKKSKKKTKKNQSLSQPLPSSSQKELLSQLSGTVDTEETQDMNLDNEDGNDNEDDDEDDDDEDNIQNNGQIDEDNKKDSDCEMKDNNNHNHNHNNQSSQYHNSQNRALLEIINADVLNENSEKDLERLKRKKKFVTTKETDWYQPDDITMMGTDVHKLYKESEENLENHKWHHAIIEKDEELDDIDLDEGYFQYKIVNNKSDLWRSKNYHMYQWTKTDGTKYRVFMQGKTTPNISAVINKYVRDWKILSQAWDAANKDQLNEYNIQKTAHDAANKRRKVNPWYWKPKLSKPFKRFWSINWTTDFGMICLNI